MTRRLGILATISLVLLGAAACTSGSATSEPTGTATPQNGMGFTAEDLCALVTQDQMSAALGASVGPGVPSGENAPSCTWQASDASGATIAATDVASVGQLPFGLQGVEGAAVTPVSGLGDKAYFAAPPSGPFAELDLAKGSRAITITVGLADPNTTQGQQEAAEQAIGAAAAANM
jgi:Protein of unknown function (DUF3558)